VPLQTTEGVAYRCRDCAVAGPKPGLAIAGCRDKRCRSGTFFDVADRVAFQIAGLHRGFPRQAFATRQM
jgi:hypothetical protein